MKIECLVKREGGSTVELFGKTYAFKPQPDGAHVAEIEDADAQDRFLSIAEGYRVYRPGRAAAPAPEKPKAPKVATALLLGSDNHPDPISINGTDHRLGDIVAAAHAASGMTADDWNALPADEREALIDEQCDLIADGAIAPATTAEPVADRESLAAQYKAKFGKAPHGKWSAEKIAEELAKAE